MTSPNGGKPLDIDALIIKGQMWRFRQTSKLGQELLLDKVAKDVMALFASLTAMKSKHGGTA